MASGGENTSYDYVDSTASKNTEIYQGLEEWTSHEIKKETKNLIKKWKNILSFVEERAKKDPKRYWDRYKATIKEYEDLRLSTIASLQEDKEITQGELLLLKEEFRDIRNVSLRPQDINEQIMNNAEKLTIFNTPVKLLKNNQLIRALKETQNNYKDSIDIPWPVKTIWGIDNNWERDGLQKKLIKKLIEEFPSFQDSHIETYSPDIGHSLERIEDVDKTVFDNIPVDKCDSPAILGKMLEYSQSDFWWEASIWLNLLTNKLNEISNNSERNSFQDKAINKILWNKDGYNNEYVKWYSNKERWGNYLVSIGELQQELASQDPKEWNSLAFANYIQASGISDLKSLSQVIDMEKLVKLNKIWEKSAEGRWIAKKILSEKDETRWIIEGVKNIKDEEIITQDFDTFSAITQGAVDQEVPKDRIEWIQAKALRDPNFISIHTDQDVTKTNPIGKEIITKTRQADFIKKFDDHKDSLVDGLSKRFWNNADILNIFKKWVGVEFDDKDGSVKKINWDEVIANVNKEIVEYNKQKWVEKIAPIDKTQKDAFISQFNDIYDINLEVNYTETLASLKKLSLELEQATTPGVKAQKQAEIIDGVEKVKAINIAQGGNWEAAQAIIDAVNNWEDVTEDIANLQAEDRKKFEDPNYAKRLDDLDNSRDELMETIYWEDWEAIILENKKEQESETEKPDESEVWMEINNENISEYHILNEWVDQDWSLFIEVESGRVEWLTQAEIEDVKTNPEMLDNMVNFHTFFKDLNMLWVWKYRNELIIAAGTININQEDDSLKESELVIFWNKLINLINQLTLEKNWWEEEAKKQLMPQTNIHWINSELRRYSEANSGISDQKTFTLNWEWKLIKQLRESWILGWSLFHTIKVWKMMNTPN